MAETDFLARLAALRNRGWLVAVHNDYRQCGERHTFWLFTHASTCYFAKGEGKTDDAALTEVEKAIENIHLSVREDAESMKRLRNVALRVLAEVRLTRRWPCPECGREGPDAPLRRLRIVACGPDREPAPGAAVRYTGCWRCNEGDRLVKAAEEGISRP